jgi:hypothetical protein
LRASSKSSGIIPGYYSIDHNLILVEKVSRKVMVNTVKKLEREGVIEASMSN